MKRILESRILLWMSALALALSALWWLPLSAQETAPPAAPPASEESRAEPEAATDALPVDERVSADNNLSFPVDI